MLCLGSHSFAKGLYALRSTEDRLLPLSTCNGNQWNVSKHEVPGVWSGNMFLQMKAHLHWVKHLGMEELVQKVVHCSRQDVVGYRVATLRPNPFCVFLQHFSSKGFGTGVRYFPQCRVCIPPVVAWHSPPSPPSGCGPPALPSFLRTAVQRLCEEWRGTPMLNMLLSQQHLRWESSKCAA